MQILLIVSLLILWTLGISAMWIDAHLTLQRNQQYGEYTGWKGVIQLAASLDKELRQNGIDHNLETDKKLKTAICKTLQGGTFSSTIGFPNGRFNYFLWVQKEKRIVASFVLSTGVTICLGVFALFFWIPIFTGVSLGLLFAFCFGSSLRSRTFIAFVITLLGVIISPLVYVINRPGILVLDRRVGF